MSALASACVLLRDYGGPEQLRWSERQVEDPAAGQVRIRHAAVGLNFIDVYHRTGLYPQPLPLTPGVEAAGIVDAVGDGVQDIKIGDRVAYAGVIGAYAEARLVDAARVVHVPDSVELETAAAVMLKGLTAYMLLRKVFEVESGQTILVHAAAGGTGLLLCQWAKELGARVIGTVSTPEKADLARANGCDHPIVVADGRFVEEVLALTAGQKVPVVYDSVGKNSFLQSLDCLQRRGTMVSFGQSSGAVDPIAPVLLSQKGSLYLTRPTVFDFTSTREELVAATDALFELLSSGRLRVHINQRFALSDIASAHVALESRATTGSTVLTL